jgi:hypothetical protein
LQTYEFRATPENGWIPIPERYKGKILNDIKVIVVDEEKSEREAAASARKSDLLLPPSADTRGWKFNREEANER